MKSDMMLSNKMTNIPVVHSDWKKTNHMLTEKKRSLFSIWTSCCYISQDADMLLCVIQAVTTPTFIQCCQLSYIPFAFV